MVSMPTHQESEIVTNNNISLRPPQSTTAIGVAAYVRATWRDYASIFTTTMLAGSVYFTPIYYYRHRVVPLKPSLWRNSINSINDLQAPTDLTYPWEQEPISSLGCGLVVVFIPISVIILFQFKDRNIWDLHAGGLGILKAVVSTTFVCVILKQFIGGFRPYYIEACNPNVTLLYKDTFHDRYWFNATACTGEKHDVAKALQTFPSGHTANAFASASFLALYLNAKLKVFTDHASEFWTFILAIIPLIGAALIAGSMYTSHQHHAYDIVWGLITGVILGVLAYRSGYAAVLDFRFNHIPLLPSLITNPCVCDPKIATKKKELTRSMDKDERSSLAV